MNMVYDMKRNPAVMNAECFIIELYLFFHIIRAVSERMYEVQRFIL